MKNLIISTILLSLGSLAHSNDAIEFQNTRNETQQIRLLPISLNAKSQNRIATQLSSKMSLALQYSTLPSSVNLGMNNVPVLDQGMHGTCATFAVTGALDAIMNKGDYISQLCHLTLGQHLSQHSYQESGWDGAFINDVLYQIHTHGIVNKTKQVSTGCAGLTQYPTHENVNPLNEMTLDEFHQLSENATAQKEYDISSLLDFYQFIKDEKTPEDVIKSLKTSLSKGDRVLIGTILTTADEVGAYGKYHQRSDTWVVTPEVISAIKSKDYGGHAMIIVGYDDKAEAIDNHGKSHKGLFILRNSWGPNAGDKGNYYMSYQYLSNLAFELIQVRSLG